MQYDNTYAALQKASKSLDLTTMKRLYNELNTSKYTLDKLMKQFDKSTRIDDPSSNSMDDPYSTIVLGNALPVRKHGQMSSALTIDAAEGRYLLSKGTKARLMDKLQGETIFNTEIINDDILFSNFSKVKPNNGLGTVKTNPLLRENKRKEIRDNTNLFPNPKPTMKELQELNVDNITKRVDAFDRQNNSKDFLDILTNDTELDDWKC